MYSILHETDESTAVNFSVSGKFLPGPGRQLVTVGAKCLKLYRLNPYAPEVDEEGVSDKRTTKLECLLTCSLMAPVRGLAITRVPKCPDCDCMVMTFNEAKLSIVSVDPATMSLNTISLHSIEDDFLRDGYSRDNFSPDLRVDPGRRCAAFFVYGRHLGVIPLQESAKEQSLQSYTIPLRSFDERLDNVLDFIFLDGYYEPTVLFLYEPIKGTAGRASIRYDTVSIIGVSLNLKDRVHAVVWSFGGLPMTIDRCLQVQSPVGGIFLVGANEIVYLSQSAPPCGISVNSCAAEFTKFPLNDHRHLAITLDGCVVEAESPNVIFIVLRSGDLYVLTLMTDAANSVKELRMDKACETCLPHTATVCSPGYLFIGSRLGDSTLIQYRKERKKGTTSDVNGVPNKTIARATFWERTREVEQMQVDTATAAEEVEDEFQSLYHGSSDLPANNQETPGDLVEYEFAFRALDSLLNVGPCKVVRCTLPSNEVDVGTAECLFDLVSASGHGKNSSLCFFERTVRPDFCGEKRKLENALQIWTVGRQSYENACHKYLIIAKELNTSVLNVSRDQMEELESPIFITSETTVAAGELWDEQIAVQVTPTSIVLVMSDTQLMAVQVETNFPIASASIAHPFVAVLTQNGRVLLYQLHVPPYPFGEPTFEQVPLSGILKHEKTPVTALSLYVDHSGLAQTSSGGDGRGGRLVKMGEGASSTRVKREEGAMSDDEADNADDDDLEVLLYGDGIGGNNGGHTSRPGLSCDGVERTCVGAKSGDIHDPNADPSYWMFLARENGNLYVYRLPEIQLVYFVKRFNQLPDTLCDDYASAYEEGLTAHHEQQAPQLQHVDATRATESVTVKPEEVIMEMQVLGMGYNQARPVLSTLIDDVVSFYEMFAFDAGINGHLAVRFRRLKCSVVTRSSRFMSPVGKNPVEAVRDSDRYRPLLCPFSEVGQLKNGLLVCGAYPCMMFIERGEPRLHPMAIDGAICTFTQFNHVDCPNGFLYVTKKGRFLRICQLQSVVNYDASYPVRKVPFPGCTVHNVVYLLQPKIYALVTSVTEPTNKLCVLVNEDKQIDTLEREDTFVLPKMDHYSLKLFSPEDWSYVPGSEVKMDEFEVVTCCDEVLLSSESTASGMKNYLAVGSVMNYGEEIYARGKIILCELVEVVPEVDQPTSRHKLKVIYNKEQKGPLTSLCACKGYLLTGMGQKIFIWQFRDGDLHGLSFLDMHFYIHSLVGFRNLALACDLYKSVSLIRYQEEFKALSVVCRDLRPTAPCPMASQFLLDNTHMGFLLSDEAANLTIFSYSPELKESAGGERFVIRAAMNLGSLVNTFVRAKGHVSEEFIDNPAQAKEVQNCIFATLDGSFGVVRPLSEKVFRRLHMLQQVMSMHTPQPAGLNPRGARFSRPQSSATSQQISTARNLVDGNLVFQYLYLSNAEKAELAKKATTNRYQIVDDLVELARLTTHF